MSASLVSATELLDTIRKAVNDWHAIYCRETGRSIEPPVYLSSLANDIAHELGIMEAIDRRTHPSSRRSAVSAVADKLDEARALIERGWCQGTYARDGCVCAYGAIQQVINGDPTDDSRGFATSPLELFVAEAVEDSDLARWNDNSARTQAEVIDAFRRAAELARAGEQ